MATVPGAIGQAGAHKKAAIRAGELIRSWRAEVVPQGFWLVALREFSAAS